MIVLGETTPTARKRHVCDSCCGGILPGQKYHRARITDGAEAWTWRAHTHCQAAGLALYDHGIEGDEMGTIPRVCDMDADDQAWLEQNHPQVHSAIWGQQA